MMEIRLLDVLCGIFCVRSNWVGAVLHLDIDFRVQSTPEFVRIGAFIS